MYQLISALVLFVLSAVNFYPADSNSRIPEPNSVIGLVDNNLIEINTDDGSSEYLASLNGIPSDHEGLKLTWSTEDNCFYTIHCPAGGRSSKIAKVTLSGGYDLLGEVELPGQTINNLEALSFNPEDKMLYASANLNNENEYISTNLIKFNPDLLEAVMVGQFSHGSTIYNPEADRMVFDEKWGIIL